MTQVVAALIWDEDTFMICQRPAHKTRGLLWEFVGGKVEPGETKQQALIRECREELAVEISIGDVFMEVVHQYPDITVELTLFNASISRGQPQRLEHNDIRFILPEEIPMFDFCPADEEILKKIIQLNGGKEKMKKVPISMVVDDPTPVLSVYYAHHEPKFTDDGRPLLEYYPNTFLYEFCRIIETYGMKGKFSVVPMPGNRGDIVNGIDGVDPAEMKEWLNTVKQRVEPRFSIVPEMLTHDKALDLETGKPLDLNESAWSNLQNSDTLTPYISRAVEILQQAGFTVEGVCSPWRFGHQVEQEYAAAIAEAMYQVTGRKQSFVRMHTIRETPNTKPWVLYDDGDKQVVTIPYTCQEHFWQTLHSPRTDDAFISNAADGLITADGKDGELVRTLETGGYPVFLCHWQSLISNGLGTGLKVLEEVGRRIEKHLSHRVQWMRFDEIMRLTLEACK